MNTAHKLMASSLLDIAARYRAALEDIAGGYISSNFADKDPPDWHEAFAALQRIAREALEREGCHVVTNIREAGRERCAHCGEYVDECVCDGGL